MYFFFLDVYSVDVMLSNFLVIVQYLALDTELQKNDENDKIQRYYKSNYTVVFHVEYLSVKTNFYCSRKINHEERVILKFAWKYD
jgi:Txe/YoeB family toxin of Txe-Axe toxin-antitoxin module